MELSALFLTTVGHVISAGILVLFGILVFLHNPAQTLNRAFLVACMAAGIFGVTFAIGINLEPSSLAYTIWMFNIIDVVNAAAHLHLAYAAVGRQHAARFFIRGVYAFGACLITAALLLPSLFLPEVVPKLFTKSYLTAGPLYYVMFIYFVGLFTHALVLFIREYIKNPEKRNQISYFILSLVVGYGAGSIDFFLVFDIPVSPLYGVFFGLYVIPLSYGILVDQVTDIRVVFKKALVYSIIIAVIAGSLTGLLLLNDYITELFPYISIWFIPFVAALVAFLGARLFWLKSIENDRVKYEFISVAAHKIRTPLTHMNLGLGLLSERQDMSEDSQKLVHKLQQSNTELIELTNLLFEEVTERNDDRGFLKSPIDLLALAKQSTERLQPQIEEKNLEVSVRADNVFTVMANERRIQAAIEVLLENAVRYSEQGGGIQVVTYSDNRRAWFSVHDDGMGVDPKDQKFIFTEFYRTDEARKRHTEGIGIGLTMAKRFVEKHGGKLTVQSRGIGTGATFRFYLPMR